MDNPEQLIIYLDIFAFVFLIAFFVMLFKSRNLTNDNKKDGRI